MKKIIDIHCSSLARPMNCAGSLFFEDLPRLETGPAAKEGTAAGEYLQHLLEGNSIPTHAKNGVPFDDDIKFHATEVAKEILPKASGSKVLCEQKIDWQTASGIIIAGKYDASYTFNGKLYIDDLKYGWKLVEVKENWQLLGYAIGEVIRRQEAFPKIVMRIHQPRPHHEDGPIREWEITYDQLFEYKERIEARMQEIAAGFSELRTGSQCKYCPAAAAACPALNRALFSSIDYTLNHFLQDDLSEKEMAYQLDLVTHAEEILKIKKDSLKDLAVSRINAGKIIPGYVMEKSLGDRKWKSVINPQVIETLTGKSIVKTEMMSPAQAEKMGVPKDLVASFVDRPFLGQKLIKKDAGKIADKIFNNK